MEALRESATGAPAIGLPRIITGIVLAAAGISVSTVPLVVRGQIAAGAAAGAAMLLIIALAVLGPWLVSLSVRLIGAVLHRLSSAGFLASANAAANSRRLASAILPIALGIGLGLVQIGAPSIIAAEAATQASAGVIADLRVTAPAGLSPDMIDTIRETPGVAEVSGVALSAAVVDSFDFEGKLQRDEHVLQGIDPTNIANSLDLRVREGGARAARRHHHGRGEHGRRAGAGAEHRRNGRRVPGRRLALRGRGRRGVRAGSRLRRPHHGRRCGQCPHHGRPRCLRARGGRRGRNG
ncbi:hypothetical protein JM654_16475 [Microbacterium oxydans]|nr:hypothetical protein [Microbacterium oxydans]